MKDTDYDPDLPTRNPFGEVPTRNPASHATKTPTGDRADKHAKAAEPHQTPVPGEDAERAAERALDDTELTRRDVVVQSSYRGDEVDIGQQAATSERSGRSSEQARNQDRG
jgi:hypothetical protein